MICCCFIFSCGKNNETEFYGVSISAPDLSKNNNDISFGEYVDLLRMSNGLGFDIFRNSFSKDSSCNNMGFSALFLYRDWYLSNYDRDYLNRIADFASINDTSSVQMCERLNEIEDLVLPIDSSINLSFVTSVENKDSLKFNQSFEFPLVYEDALKTKSLKFFLNDTLSQEREFFSLSENFNCVLTEKELVAEIPIGNGSFSLMMITPLQLSWRNYAASLSEEKYIQLIESLEKRNTTIIFPAFEDFCESIRLYPPLQAVISDSATPSNIIVDINLKFRQPNEALLQSMQKTLGEKIINTGNGEPIVFDKPFIFIIKENNSRMVLLQGTYVK